MRKSFMLIFCLVLILAGSYAIAGEGEEKKEQKSYDAVAILQNASGEEVGKVKFIGTPNGLHVILKVKGLPKGTHAFHIHGTGKCDPPDFKSAGGHFNPAGKEHGWYNPKGYHAGDLPNIHVGESGKLKVEVFVPGLKVDDLFGEAGTAVVIHEGADDLKSDPAGNAGSRIACGVITRPSS